MMNILPTIQKVKTDPMILHIKSMVCIRCKMLVKKILDDLHIKYTKVELGYVALKQPITNTQKDILKKTLKTWDLFLIENNKEILVEKIKKMITNIINMDNEISYIKTSYYLSDYLSFNYTYLANVFSQQTGICIRDYIIARKIEKAKELLVTDGLSVTEVANKLSYSSVAHLSNQFTKVTGLSPSKFKKNTTTRLITLDKIGMLEAV